MRPGARTTQQEHALIRAELEKLRELADQIEERPSEEVLARAAAVHEFLAHTVMPHAVAEGRVLMPLVRDRTGEPTIGVRMTQCHVQVGRLVDELDRQLGKLRAGSARAERELRRILYSLHALLTAHLDEADEEVEPLLEAELPEDQRQELFDAIERCAREVADLYE
jgi:hemerythrin-like domain-containing protein